jgi:1-acyl-sn-glycerol-3-phosphate acyltransferase
LIYEFIDSSYKELIQLKIAIVLDVYDLPNNGTTVSAVRFVERLRARGHEVRIVTTGKPGEGKYIVPDLVIPGIDRLVKAQGYAFAKTDADVIRRAFEGVDLVHFYTPLNLSIGAEKIARRMGIPTFAAFHLQPENLLWNIGLRRLPGLRHLVYRLFYILFFRRFAHIHCPSRFIAGRLREHGYRAQLHVISNGVDPDFCPGPAERPPEWRDRFVIAMVGRLSPEKRQDTLIEAISRSRYRDRIQLVLAGAGPLENRYRRLGRKLPHPPHIEYYTKEKLIGMLRGCDLYVHASDIEIEAISCMEAFSCGLVPVIANASESATPQFALDERSLFTAGDPDALARRIDWWLEHPEERARMAAEYARAADALRVDRSVEAMEAVYRQVIEDARAAREKSAYPQQPDQHMLHMWAPLKKNIDEHFPFINRKLWFRFNSWLLGSLVMPLLLLYNRVVNGFRIEGRHNLRGTRGAVTVANHVHVMDATMLALTLFPRRAYITSLQSNFEIPVISWLVRMLGGVPIPGNHRAITAFMAALREQLERGKLVHFYPETALWPYYENLRPFKNGAFRLAVEGNVPVIPMVFRFRKPTGLYRLYKRKPLTTLIVGEPIYPAESGTNHDRMNDLKERTYRQMEKLLNQSA